MLRSLVGSEMCIRDRPSRISTARYRPCTYAEDQGAVFSSYSSTTSTRNVTGGVTSVPALRIRRAILTSNSLTTSTRITTTKLRCCTQHEDQPTVIGKLVYGHWQTRVWSLATSCMVIGKVVYGHWQSRVRLFGKLGVGWANSVWVGQTRHGF